MSVRRKQDIKNILFEKVGGILRFEGIGGVGTRGQLMMV